jgi:hypothetical protein
MQIRVCMQMDAHAQACESAAASVTCPRCVGTRAATCTAACMPAEQAVRCRTTTLLSTSSWAALVTAASAPCSETAACSVLHQGQSSLAHRLFIFCDCPFCLDPDEVSTVTSGRPDYGNCGCVGHSANHVSAMLSVHCQMPR